MSEFLHRIDAQRAVLAAVNRHAWEEPLFGLSHGSIERWAGRNSGKIPQAAYSLVIEAAEKLFFLANKSQDQITEEYSTVSRKIGEIVSYLNKSLNT